MNPISCPARTCGLITSTNALAIFGQSFQFLIVPWIVFIFNPRVSESPTDVGLLWGSSISALCPSVSACPAHEWIRLELSEQFYLWLYSHCSGQSRLGIGTSCGHSFRITNFCTVLTCAACQMAFFNSSDQYEP